MKAIIVPGVNGHKYRLSVLSFSKNTNDDFYQEQLIAIRARVNLLIPEFFKLQ
jgi:hypothetical protein